MESLLTQEQIDKLNQIKTELSDLERFTITLEEFSSWFDE